MTPRRQRMLAVTLIVLGAGSAAALGLFAYQENVLYFYSPSAIAAGEAPAERRIRMGGMVTAGSVQREEGSLAVRFVLTDNQESIPVSYEGILPDLFREGQGIVVHGRLAENNTFVADEVLAKHDENYMPPEVADSLKAVGTAE
ncbi:MAG: cytochrome c maturation protein CcmE [Pseudomonadota bacterium]